MVCSDSFSHSELRHKKCPEIQFSQFKFTSCTVWQKIARSREELSTKKVKRNFKCAQITFSNQLLQRPWYKQITLTFSHLICTLISENEGLDNLRSASNLRKNSVPAHLNFFSVCHLSFFQIYTIDLKKTQVTNWKKIQVCRNWNFSKVWSRPWFLKTYIFRNQGAD